MSSSTSKRLDYISWDEFFMGVAELSAKRSKDPSTQVGACIVDKENKIVGVGYNGFPRLAEGNNADELLPWAKTGSSVLETKYIYVCHAELNAICNKNTASINGCKMFVTLFPCNECTKLMIQSGIKEVIYKDDKYHDSEETIASRKMLDLANIKYIQYNLKE